MRKHYFLSMMMAVSAQVGMAQCIVNIPDANFKAALVGNVSINTNGDDEIQCDEAAAFTGLVNCPNLGITDLTGIEAFTAATVLRCFGNQLTELDLSNNTALITIWCFENQIASLNIGSNAVLTSLQCYGNELTSIDVSSCPALTHLDCSNNQLSTVDVSNNPALLDFFCGGNSLTGVNVSANSNLQVLNCSSNQIATLDVSNNIVLNQLNCSNNALAALDVSNNPSLTMLHCFQNQLTTLDVSNNLSLTSLACGTNQITSLDLSQHGSLSIITVQDNELTYLNVANGINASTPNHAFAAQGNPNLTCIEVDDAAWSTANWFNVDATATFSENCLTVGIDESPTVGTGIFPNPTSGILNLTQPASGQVLDLSGRSLMTFSNARSIDLSTLVSGSYMVRTVDGSVRKVVKE